MLPHKDNSQTILDVIDALRREVINDYIRQDIAVKSKDSYEREMWLSMLAFYNLQIQYTTFVDDMKDHIKKQFNAAWVEGASDMNIRQWTFTQEDMATLETMIAWEYAFIAQLVVDIDRARTVGLGASPFKQRASLWANRYDNVLNAARTHFGGQQLLEWVLGMTEKHCASCLALNGTVATANEWKEARKNGVYPQSPMLACHGYRCDCQQLPTNNPPTGAIPTV
jgi:hypothetical protein